MLVMMALACGVGLAQSTVGTGSILGTVTDPSGALVAGAKVVITNTQTAQTIETKSSTGGAYTAGSLAPGAYKVQVTAPGFSTLVVPVTVRVGNSSTVNAQLQVGKENEVVEVQGTNVEVNTEQATVQGVLNAQQIENLPVNGRNFLDLAQLEPGVQIQDGANFDPTKVGFSSLSIGGRFGRTARIEVDGVDVSDETVGTTTEDIPASAIEEFQISQSSLDLSTELSSSGAVNVVTRSGSNDWHGEGFYFFRDSRVSASLPTPPGLDSPFQRHQYGGRFGGPVIKDKLFFFVDGERTLQHLQAPVLEVNQGGAGTPGNFAAYSGTFQSPFKETELVGRLDYQLSSNAKLFYRFSYFQNSDFATFFPSSYQVYDSKNITRQNVVGADFSKGTLTHSLRYSYLKFENQIIDAARGSGLPFADFPVSINIGPLSTGPNLLAPQGTPQSNNQAKYDGSWTHGKHIIRYGASYNHITAGGFAAFYGSSANVYGSPSSLASVCITNPSSCPLGPDGTIASNPQNYAILEAIIGTGQGFSTERPALGFPAGGLGPDNRLGLYLGDTWKVLPNFTVNAGLRWVRDTGRTDSDLGALPELNVAFPGYGNRVRQPNANFAPQLGIAWSPGNERKTVLRAGVGLYYENVIFNNILFDRPLRLTQGAFLYTPDVCLNGSELPVQTSIGTLTLPAGTCNQSIGQAAQTIASFQNTVQALSPFNLSAPNPEYVGNLLANGQDVPLGLFAPNYRSPRSIQINAGFQREIRRGTVLTADYVRNVTTQTLLGIDVNHVGDASHLNLANAQEAIANTLSACGAGTVNQAIANCPALHPTGAPGATFQDFASFGLTSSSDFGGACATNASNPLTGAALGYGCAFGGINSNYGALPLLFPVGRSVYNALQVKLNHTLTRPVRGLRGANIQIAYSLSRFVSPGGNQGNFPPSNPVASGDQDFVLQAADNNQALRYTGPSLLDRTHQLSFGGTFDLPRGFRVGAISHFYSPLASAAIVGNTGQLGDILRTDFTGDGTISDPVPGTKQGSFGRDFGVSGLNQVINSYNANVANQATPAGQALISQGLFTLTQLQQLGGVAPTVPNAPPDQVGFHWLRTTDLRLSWNHTFAERVTLEPSVAFYNVFNFSNFDLPPGVLNGWLNAGSGSINSTNRQNDFRVGQGTGVFSLASPRQTEFGMRLTF